MALSKSKEIQTGMAFPDCIDSIGSELAILGTVRQPKLPHAIVDNKPATPILRTSE